MLVSALVLASNEALYEISNNVCCFKQNVGDGTHLIWYI